MSDTFSFENLFGGCQKPPVNHPATVRVYEAFSRGQIVGRLTATDKWQMIAEAGVATCNLFGIASEAIDTTDGTERKTTVYVEGEFNETGVLYAYGDTADTWRDFLETKGIFLRKAVNTAGV